MAGDVPVSVLKHHYNGVYLSKNKKYKKKRYEAKVCLGGLPGTRTHLAHIGYYGTEEEAAIAFDIRALSLLNFPDPLSFASKTR